MYIFLGLLGHLQELNKTEKIQHFLGMLYEGGKVQRRGCQKMCQTSRNNVSTKERERL